MYVIAVENQKGGACKSTTSVCLAAALEADGLSVLLLDSDKQGTSSDWHALATSLEHPVVPSMQILRPVLHKEVPRMDYDVVIIDGPARNEGMTENGIDAADLVIIPVQPSPFDIWATKELIDTVKEKMESREGTERPLKAVFLVTRAAPRTKLGRAVRGALEAYELPVFKTIVRNAQDYPNTMANGQTPLNLRKGSPTRLEVLALKDEVVRFITGAPDPDETGAEAGAVTA